ncbi:N-acetyltransferase family protein [candidate division KSB1 bacterium]|nr:N-acetyltransferase family protein [candidate division KSB1 bacterium]
MITVRPAEVEDILDINAIYNDAIRNTVATFDTEPKSLEWTKNWLLKHDEKHPVLVTVEDEKVIAWASLSPWSDRSAYDGTAELSVYVQQDKRGAGLGRELMKEIIEQGKKTGLHTLISRISGDNDVSFHLHKAFGFEEIGILREVGHKFNQWIDVYMYQLMI